MIGRMIGPLRRLASKAVNSRSTFELHQDGDVVVGRDVEGLHRVHFEGKNTVSRGTIFSGIDLSIGYATTIGANAILHGPLIVGRYCQLGPAIAIYGSDHPTSHLTTYISSNLFMGRLSDFSQRKQVSVGNDVWIGHGAVLLKGIEVGNGAIIGAGSVVTKTVPAYTIVAGNPARVLRFRFNQSIIELLQELEWWNLSVAEMKDIEDLFCLDINEEEDKAIHCIQEFIKAKMAQFPVNVG